MGAYDALPDFNCNDPQPFAIPRPRVSIFRRVVAWGGVIAMGVVIWLCAFVAVGQAVSVVWAQ